MLGGPVSEEPVGEGIPDLEDIFDEEARGEVPCAETGEENRGQRSGRGSFVLLRSEGNALGGLDIVVPWLPAALFRSGRKRETAAPREKAFMEIGKRSLRVLSAAMVAHYYLQKEPALSMASVGTQVKELAFPVFAAYTAGVYLAPIGAVMYGLAGLKLLSL